MFLILKFVMKFVKFYHIPLWYFMYLRVLVPDPSFVHKVKNDRFNLLAEPATSNSHKLLHGAHKYPPILFKLILPNSSE